MPALKSALRTSHEQRRKATQRYKNSADKLEHLNPIGLEVKRISRPELLLLIDVDRERGDLRLRTTTVSASKQIAQGRIENVL